MSAHEPPAVDPLRNERFHLDPENRLKTIATISGTVGAALGMYEGIKMSSLRYLTENAHRLPRTVGGWYFYHKKKNYVMITSGGREAVKTGIKYSLAVTSFFALEAAFDYARQTKDFLSTAAAGAVVAFAHGTSKKMSPRQRFSHVRKGALMALALGIGEDVMIHFRGGDLWYLRAFRKYMPVSSDTDRALQPN